MKWFLLCLTLISFYSSAQQEPTAPPAKPKIRPAQPKKSRTQTAPPKTESPVLAPVQPPATEEKPAEEKSTWEKIKETGNDVLEKTKETAEKASEQYNLISLYRGKRTWVITGNYSYFDLIVPGKYGVTVGYVKDAGNTYEIDYMRGSLGFGWLGIDIGSITEQRLALLWRSYNQRNTFNFQMGVNYNKFEIKVGDTLLNKVAGAKTDYDVMDIQTLGLSWGIGNRWQTKGGFVWAFDWLQLHVPVVTIREHTPFIDATTDQEDREDAQSAVKIIRHFPRLAALKFQIGFSF